MSRTILTNGSVFYRNIGVGDGSLNSRVILINGVETIRIAPNLKCNGFKVRHGRYKEENCTVQILIW